MLENIKSYSFWDILKHWAFSIIFLPVMIYWVVNRGEYGLIDNADLIIHEGGHLFFWIFGRFIYTLGGTLMQIILPSILAWHFFSKEYLPGTQIFLLWLGQNFINISVYAADAVRQKLPLLGGKSVYHDWNYLLSELHLLAYAEEVGYFFLIFAVIIFIITLFMPYIIPE